MTELVINDCYGGFSLSPKAVERYAELKGFKIYWFQYDFSIGTNNRRYSPVKGTPENRTFGASAYTSESHEDGTYFSDRDIERDDPTLVQVVKELGDEASGALAKLKVVEIPDDVEWTIEEYDGIEWVSETHRTWS